MLSFMMNRWNCIGDHQPDEIRGAGLEKIGISAQLPSWLRKKIAKAAKVCLYDSDLAVETMSEEKMTKIVLEAQDIAAEAIMVGVGHSCDQGRNEQEAVMTLATMQAKCQQEGIRLVITNRRTYQPEQFIAAEKLRRLSQQVGCGIAFDPGFSHAYGKGLEDFFDIHEQITFLLMNDNYGIDVARWPVGHPDFDPTILPDDFRQPGYGTVPYPAVGEAMRQYGMDIPMLMNGMRHQNATLDTVIKETRRLLAGKVFINPAGGQIGRDWHTDRIL